MSASLVPQCPHPHLYSFGIDYVQPPMIGLYALANSSMPVESPAVVASFFSSVSATVATTLPNFVLATPTYTTPPYAFNTSVPATLGEIVDSELATSTYWPLAVSPALPTLFDAYTLIETNSQGQVVTSTYHLTEPSVVLGEPPGWSGARMLHTSIAALCISLLVAICASVWVF